MINNHPIQITILEIKLGTRIETYYGSRIAYIIICMRHYKPKALRDL